MRLLLANRSFPLLKAALEGTNTVTAAKLAEALGHTGKHEATELLLPLVRDSRRDAVLRVEAVRALVQTSEGSSALLGLVKEQKLADDLKPTASLELSRVRWP